MTVHFRLNYTRIILFFILLATSTTGYSTVRYVMAGATGSAPYTSWATASGNLQTVINYCNAGDSIWVTQGSYQPAAGTSFVMKEGVKIYAGFTGVETDFSQRDVNNIVTALEGNGSHVIDNSNNFLTNAAVLDGFNVQYGSATNGAGIYNVNSSPSLINLLIRRNTADNYGGGVYNENSSPLIYSCNVQFNTAQYGGGVANRFNSSPTIWDNSIAYNTAYVGGGISSHESSSPSIYAFFGENTAVLGGGLAVLDNSVVTADGGSISHNHADYGGGFYTNNSGSITLNETTVIFNDANFNGGGGYNLGNATVSFLNQSCNLNTAEYGGFLFNSGNVTITGFDLTIGNNTADYGGAIANIDGPIVTLDSCTVYNNHANRYGGVFYNQTSSPSISNSSIYSNTADEFGGVMFNIQNASPTITNSSVRFNSALSGAVMANADQSSPSLDGCTLYLNTATDNGGVIFNHNSSPNIFNTTIHSNNALSGAVMANFGQSSPLVEGCTIYSNTASGNGGVLYSKNSSPTVTNCNIYQNNAANGGGMYNDSLSVLTVNGGSIYNNSGCGIYNNNSATNLNNVSIYNHTNGSRGAITNMDNSTLTIDGGSLTVNNNTDGGAIHSENSAVNISNATISNNTASGKGGAIFNLNGNTNLTNVVINNNDGGIGGGICDEGTGTQILHRVIIRNNTGSNAGGIAGLGTSTITGTDVLMFGNNTTSNGGNPFPNGSAITLAGASSGITLINSSVANNNGGMNNNAISTQGSLTLSNSIVFGGTASGTHQYSYSLAEGYNDISNGNVNATCYTAADVFTNPSAGDYTLKATSPAVNRGNNALYPGLDASSIDLAGNARVYEYSGPGVIDLGAYESSFKSIAPDAFGVVYVSTIGAGQQNGSSWEDATNDLQKAINAQGVVRVYVAKGTYTVGCGSFIMKQNVGIYGGFDPDNNIRTLDDKRIAPTLTTGSILDGANTRPVIWNVNNGLTSSATLDGFTLTNAAGVNQGSIYNDGASPRLRNLFIAGNNTSGIYNLNSSPTLTNVRISGNSARGIYHHGGNPTLLNTTIAGNTGEATVVITGSITANNSLICGTINGAVTNNYSLFTTDVPTINSLFVDYTGGDYSLKYNSPAVDAGNNSLYSGLSPETRDLASNPRLFGTTIDMGAYEFNLLHDVNNIAYVSTTGAGKHDGSSWEHATTNLQGAINSTGTAQVFVAKGTYTVGANSYIMKNGVEIYGGFDPDNNIRTLDDDRIAPTLTTGSILNGNNARPVIWNVNNGVTVSAVLDGFTLTNATGNNQGAIYNTGTSPTLRNVLITTNNTNGIYNTNASPTLINVCLSSNGIAMYQNGGTASLINTTIAGNTTAANIVSGGITAKNSLVCGTVSGSITDNASIITADAGIINSIFADYGGGDYSLKYAGPATNTGNNSLFPGLSAQTKDLAGNARLFGTNIDLGAYEFNILHDANNIVYVSTTGAGKHDGSSWENATSVLQGAINTPGATKVFVAKGTYTVGGNSYIMKDGVEIYGGFDPGNNIRTLDDDRIAPTATAGSILNGNNTRPVIWNVNNGVTASAVLDGFTLTNAAGNNQGSVYNTGTSPTLRNLLITTNNTNGVYNTNASPTLINVCLSSNSTAMYQNGGTASLINTTIAGNTTAANIASGGITANNSLVCGTVSGSMTNNTSIITTDVGVINSLFADFAGGDYSLSYDSPAINAGDNSLFPGLSAQTKDLAGSPRLFGTNIDMGAYESGLSADNYGIIYVKTIGVGVKNGSSWENATNDLHAALIAKGVQKIFVAKGTYPVGGSSYTMKNNLEIYGGFDPENNIRTLDDDRILPSETESGSVLDGQGTKQVIVNVFTAGTALDTSAVLDGFTVSGGYTSNNGGGMYNEYASPLLRHVVFQSNSTRAIRFGGGMYNSNSSPVLRQCSFLSNSAGYGGGVYNASSAPTFANCLFENNSSNIAAGALYNTGSTTTVTNTRFISNTSSTYTAAIHAASGDLTMINCLFSGNQSPLNSTGAIHLPGGTNTLINVTMAGNGDYGISGNALYNLKNSIIWDEILGNYDADHCMIKNKSDETNGNLDATAYTAADIFMDPATGNYALKSTSPVIDQGDNRLFPGLNGSTKDLAGNLRLMGTKIDMGAFEFGTPLPVKLLSFTVQKQGESAVLTWRTATEQNNHGFEIQRSTDGKYWTPLTFIPTQADGGNSLSPLQYSYSDDTPAKAVNYYRLKQMDRNGSFEYSIIRSVSFDGGRAINVYPNPATIQVTVTGLQKEDHITLVDGLGNKVRQYGSDGEEMTVPMDQLQRGIYYIVVTNAGRAVATFKVVKGE